MEKKHCHIIKLVALLLIYLSKTFDCLPHRLLVAKLHAYGLSEECSLVVSYSINHKQRVKMGDTRSDWICVLKCILHGSILGPNYTMHSLTIFSIQMETYIIRPLTILFVVVVMTFQKLSLP